MKKLFATVALLSLLVPCFGQGGPNNPGIAVEPQSQTAPAGSAVTLNVTASGTAPFSYQWWNSVGAITDATNADYSLNPAETNESGDYTVTISNGYGSITSSVATVSIGLPPSISVQPMGQTALAGANVTLSVTAAGSDPLTYQWWDSTGSITDATNAVYSLNPAETNESDDYAVTIANGYGSITSSVATVSIGLPPSISVQPMGQTALAGANVTLSVTTAGSAPLTYQWWDSTGSITDATNAVYSLNPAETNESDNYTVTIANGFGSITSSVATVSIGLPPSILVQPMGQTVAAGSALTLSVTASGTAPFNYQWWNSGGAIVDATNAVYSLNPAETNDSDDYTVTISNTFGSITSSVATVSIGLPPSILVQPMGQTAPAGSAVSLSVTATGTAPLNYQWWNSGGAIPDATNAVYSLNPAETNDSDDYTVTIANGFGSITSSVATVSIGLAPTISVQPMGQTALAGSAVTLSVTASGTAPLNYQWWDSTGAILDATNAVYSLNPAETNESDDYTVTINNGFGSITSSVATVSIGVPPTILVQPMGQTALVGSAVSLSVTAAGSDPLTYQWWDSGGAILDATNAVYSLNPAETNESDDYTVTIANGFGSITSSVATVSIGLAPTILVQPMGQTALVGSAVSLSVTASGSAPLNYQWWNSTGAILDATNAVYSLNPAETNESDDYTVTINNGFGSITSSVATVSIGVPPTILVQPMGQTALVGSAVTLSVTAAGSAPLNYQWWDSAGAIQDATNAVYSLNPAETNESDNYTVTIINGFGSITSSVATVSIGLPPSILVQPMGQTALAGSAVTLSVTASGTAPLNYQWWNSAGAIPDATNAIYSLNPAETNESDDYTVTITNAYGSITSSVATVSIGLPPSILVQPMGQTALAGSAVTLTVTATGSAPLNYQWWNSGGAIPDATNAIYSLNPAETNDSDDYTVTISNTFGSITSSVATVSIGLPPSILVQPMGQTAPAGSAVSLSVTATGTAPLNYQWWDSGGAIPDATNAVYSLNPAETNESDNYTVTITNAYGSITSSVASVTIGLPPSILVQPMGQNVAAGSALTLSVTATGSAPLNYQWWDSGGAILDATNAVYSLNPAETNESDDYTVTISNGFGSITSSVASVTIGMPPSILVQPMGQAVVSGAALTLSVTAAGSAPLNYQWWNSGGAIPDATNAVYSLNPAETNESDNYTVTITNAFGSITSSVATVSIGLPPSILVQPMGQNVAAGAALTLSVTASGTAPFSYQWWDSGGAILDATNAVYSLNPAETNESDNYTVTITNAYGSITSSVASVTIGLPPSILVQPMGQTVAAGSALTLSVTAAGTAPLNYQWQLNGTNLPNDLITTVAGNGITDYNGDGIAATNASLNIPYGLAVDGLGDLYIVETGGQRVRKVDTNNLISTVAGNGVRGYSGDGGAATNASFLFPLDVAFGPSGQLLVADQDNHRIRQVDINGIITTVVGNGVLGNSGDGGAATNARLSFPHGLAIDSAGNLFIADSGTNFIRRVDTNGIITTTAGNGGQGYSGDGGAATNASLNTPTGVVVDGSGNLFIADSDNNCVRKVDTRGIITTVAGNGLPGYSGDGGAATNASLNDPTGVAVDTLGNLFIADSQNSLVRQVDSAGIISTIAGNYVLNQYNYVGGYSGDGGAATNASLFYPYRVVLDTSGDLFIADLDNNRIRQVVLTTEPAIAIHNLNTNNEGDYTVIVSNAFGSITSSVASVSIGPPSISVQPMGQAVAAGSALTLSVTVAGTAPLNYQWWNSGGAILDATNAVYSLNPAETNESDDYTVTITNAYGSITSSVASVSIGLPPSILVQPMGQAVVSGAALNLSVTATGTAPLNYQWWDSAGAIPDATNADYNLNPAETNESDDYTVTITNAYGSITSSVASVSIGLPPSILVQPMGQNVAAGSALTLTVTASGTAPFSYQWWDSGGAIPDATNAVYSLNPAETNESDDYTVTITNAFGSITSSVASVTIGLPPSILVQPMGQAVVSGAALTLSVTAAGTAPLNYQWWNSAGAISDATNAVYNLTPAEPDESDDYTVTITNAFGSTTSSVASVTIDLPPAISVQPMGQMVVEGSNATFCVVATGDDLHYQWYGYGGNDTNLVDGATNASLTVITDGEGSQVYNLLVVVTNLAGEVTSSNASLTVLTVLTGPINPYPPGTLGYDLFQSTFTLASSTNRTATYDPPSSNLGSNSAVWTWPVNLSCVGQASDGYQSVLIASNELLSCAHDGGESGQTVTFHDTNGVSWVGVVTNVIHVISDLDISQLSNSAPASIVIPYVLPPNYGLYIAGNSLLGMPAFWVHQGTGSIDYAPVAWVGIANLFGGESGAWMQLIHNGYGAYSGSSAVPGDSGDAGFMSLSNNPILLFALDLTPDSGGMFVSGALNWYWLAALGLTNGLNMLDLSGYPLQSAATPTPDYNYIVPPTNQLASPGTLVTFDVSVCVFNTSPFAYQWQWNGTNLAGATNAVLAFQAATTNLGNYSVIVSNELGAVTVGATLALTSTSNQLARILTPVVTHGQFQFGFNTISNYSYSVQYEDNLASGNWVVLTNFTGSGSYWQTPRLPLVTQRFYRFVASSP